MPDPRDDDTADADERAWQDIVDNYGDRVELDEPPVAPPSSAPTSAPTSAHTDAPFGGRFGDPAAFGAPADDPDRLEDPADPDDPDDGDGYRPPPPPPLPTVAPDRALAWAGVFGSPTVLLVALILSVTIPSWLGYLLVVGFVGGFVYLVMKMPREPREPWDDGAQV